MSKRAAKSQASSARAATTGFGPSSFGSSAQTFGISSSVLSYVTEPPDLSAVSDPNVVVYFRNLSKKDSTTKARALEDLQSHVSSLQEPVEEGILEAWVKIYPRTSIDNSRAVRQIAHTVHGLIATSAGKRIAKHMPKSVAAWLCGLYDNDRSVVEATQNSLRQVFNTPEKIQNIRKIYQQPILEYCRDAIDKENSATLSDARTVSPDDAEAKYSRVISASISLLGSLLANLSLEELSKFQADYDSLLQDKKLWDFASHTDPSIRRSVHRFLKTAVAKQPEAVEESLELISKSYLSVALNSDQNSSAFDYIDALNTLTVAYPTSWTTHYKSKTAVDRRLRQFLKKGSQFAPRDYWSKLLDLIKATPLEILPPTTADAADFLNALQGGIMRKDEPRSNLDAALATYFDVFELISGRLPEEDQTNLTREKVFPILTQFLRPTPDTSQWTLPSNPQVVLREVLALRRVGNVLSQEWPKLAQELVNSIKTSAPEQSKDYERSQSDVQQFAQKFAILQEEVFKTESLSSLNTVLVEATSKIISEAVAVLKSRNGKPYGGAAAIAAFLQHQQSRTLTKGTREDLEGFVANDVPNLILSPSSTYLVDILYSFSECPTFEISWTATLKCILQEGDTVTKKRALEALLTSQNIPDSFDLALKDLELQKYVLKIAKEALEGSVDWDSFSQILRSRVRVFAPATTDEILANMTESLTIAEYAPHSLQGLRQIIKSDPSLLRQFLQTPKGGKLLQSLLLASESPDEEAAQNASAVNASMQALLSSNSHDTDSRYRFIQQGVQEASQTTISVATLVDLAKQCLKPGSPWEDITKALPTTEDWNDALTPFLNAPPKPSLAITNPLGGAIYLVEQETSAVNAKSLTRDADGYVLAYRIGLYITKIFAYLDLFSTAKLPSATRSSYVRLLALTIELVDDDLGLAGAHGLWSDYNTDAEADAMTFLTDARSLVTAEIRRLAIIWSEQDSGIPVLDWATEMLARADSGHSARAFYEARACAALLGEAVEVAGWRNAQTPQLQDILKHFRKQERFSLFAFINAFAEPLAASKSCDRLCNEVIADLTGLNMDTKPDRVLRQLVLLNILLQTQETLPESIAKQRLIFFIKHVISWLQADNVPHLVKAELYRSLTILVPMISDLYGEHWAHLLASLSAAWSATETLRVDEAKLDSNIPFTHASLKFYAQLRTLTQAEDPNDDLLDAWKASEQPIANGLINLLKGSQHFPDAFHQPLRMVNEVLARQIAKVPLKHLESSEELFPLLYVESRPVQQTAFDILHKQIPAAQEQISIDAVLEKSTARLPEELLSLIIDAPTVGALAEANFEQNVPLSLRGYLLSWLLVFDHLEHSSFKVKNDYVDQLKEGEYLPGLLNFTFNILGHAHNKPVDVSRLDATTYNPDTEPPKRDLQWLLTHLYFLCLKNVPSLTKSWFIDSKSRATVVTLVPWTEKFISPPVITAALNSVSEWSTNQADNEPDSPFTVKVAPRAREITASYLIDEQPTSIRISLPPSFPLSNARIEGLSRVAVTEQKWQSWLRTSLGAITLFNGSLIDALTTFKRNVEGAMKGQTECAICYSIVGADRKLPDKKCGTCKHSFHGGCLWKWFKTSESSSCPLCRTPFQYG